MTKNQYGMAIARSFGTEMIGNSGFAIKFAVASRQKASPQNHKPNE
ncbi:MAG: hypothetical protein ACI4A8_06885 [Muribaculaceae bacterium]